MLDRRRARYAWLAGARAVARQRSDEARPHFEKAVDLDPGMADAWLGLHAVGHRRDEALAAMTAQESRFGEERERQSVPLESRFDIGTYIDHRLRTHFDLWCAVAAWHLQRGETESAGSALTRVKSDAAAAAFLRGRIAFTTGRVDDAIESFRLVFGADNFLEAEARLLSAAALAEVGATGPARTHLNWVLGQSFLPAMHPEARYLLGLIARAEGDEDSARSYFQLAYAERPSLPGLKEELARSARARIRITRTDGSTPGGSAGDSGKYASNSAATDSNASTNGQATGSDPDDGAEDDGDGEETVEQILAELDRQIGQDGIKRQVRGLLAQTRAQLARRELGLRQARLTEHFVFTGPPGTGKTTIARVVARLYKALGILEGGHVIEVDRSGLIGEYHGHTVAKTKNVLDEAMGGVLFIDEAYALRNDSFGSGDPFGQEAIDTLLKRMEDDRDKFIVIAAGYPEPMERFLDSNPGLRSRFTTTIAFHPYSVDELAAIAEVMAIDSGNALTDDGRESVHRVLDRLSTDGTLNSSTFGNARFVRNLLEKAARQRDHRLFGEDSTVVPTADDLVQLTAVDVDAAAGELI